MTDSIDSLDHKVITGLLKAYCTSQLKYKRTVRHFTTEILETLCCTLHDIDWHTLLAGHTNADECTESFTAELTKQLDLIIPPETVTVRPGDKPGMTNYVRKLFKRPHALCRLAKQTKNNADNAEFCHAKRKAKKAWFDAQQKHHAKIYAKVMGPGGQ